MAEIFISYNREDQRVARRYAEAFERAGLSVWWDTTLKTGENYDEVTEAALRNAKAVVVLWSPRSVVSRWVRAEATVAQRAQTLLPVMIEACERPIMFELTQTADLTHWTGASDDRAWLAYVADVRRFIGKAAPVAEPAARIAAVPKRDTLLAVLAFDNLSPDTEMDYFSDGVAAEIQQTLSQSSGINVLARSSTFQFRGAHKAVKNVAEQLQVTHMLDGSVRRSGQRVRITAQLVDCITGLGVWTDRFDRNLDDIFALQDEIAQACAKALHIVFAPAVTSNEMPIATYEMFLKAQSIISEGAGLFDDSGVAATPLLLAVVAEAPQNARAWELLAKCRAWTLRGKKPKPSFAQDRAAVILAAETALRLDPARGGAYEALALLEPWAAHGSREALLRKALAAQPGDPGILSAMSSFCWGVGRGRDALRFAEKACELNPLLPAARLAVAQLQEFAGNDDGSLRMLAEVHARWPDNFNIMLSLLTYLANLERWDAFHAMLPDTGKFEGTQAVQLGNTIGLAAIQQTGDPEGRRSWLKLCEERLEKNGTIALNYLTQTSILGMPEQALSLAERSSYDHMFAIDGTLPASYYPGTLFSKLNLMNRDPAFVDLCARIGLCDYWASSNQWPDCTEWLPYDLKDEVRRRLAR